jgi:hypothetical protein
MSTWQWPFNYKPESQEWPYGIDDLILVNGEYQKIELQEYHDPDYYEKLKYNHDNRKTDYFHQN